MAKKILAVDDEPGILKLLDARLKASGYEVATAVNGADALEKMKAEKPDLIILDVLMPVMGGLEFFKLIKINPKYVNIPIMIFTGRGPMRDTFEFLGADDFITKPFESSDFLARVSTLLIKKALLMASDPVVVSKVSAIFEKLGYGVVTTDSEAGMLSMGKETRYEVILAHLSLITKEPLEFIQSVHALKHKNPRVIIYSDVTVKGTEGGNSLLIDEIKTKWRRAGAKSFYDPRTDRSLNDIIESVI